MNIKPLTCIENDIAHQPLTENSILLGCDLVLPTDISWMSGERPKKQWWKNVKNIG